MSLENLENSLKKLEKLRASSKGQITNALADVLNDVGVCYQEQCEFEKSLQHQYESLAMRREIYKDDQNQHCVAETLNNIAVTYSKMNDLNNALKYHKKTLLMRKSLIKGMHPYIATTLSNIGVIYDKMSN